MIYLTGDTHKNLDLKKLLDLDDSKLTKQDYMIILGDFGFPFCYSDHFQVGVSRKAFEKSRQTYWKYIDWLKNRPYTILFIDGNHENHAFWKKQKVEELFGGKVQPHPHASNIYHLMRGEIYNIDGYTFFCMGGANSIDQYLRKEGETWWKEEIPSLSERLNGLRNLEKYNYQVDFILTHCMPNDFVPIILKQIHKMNDITGYFNQIAQITTYRYWFCGHYHVDLNYSPLKMQILYNTIVPITNYL